MMFDVMSLLRADLVPLQPYAIPNPPGIRVRMDANESPHSLPPEIRSALAALLTSVPLHRYPDGHATALRGLVSQQVGCDPAQLVFGNGSDELIPLLMDTFARPRPGQERPRVAYPWPSFIVYRIAALGRGHEPIEIPLAEDFTLDAGALDRALRDARPNLVFFALPNNPTGTLWPREIVADVLERYPDMLVVADEAYLAYSGETHLDLLQHHPNLVILRTFSKIGLAGLRVGYLIARPEVAAAVEKIRPPYNVGAINQAAAVHLAEQCGDWYGARTQEVIAERERVVAALAAVTGLRAFPTRANFVLIRVGSPGDGRATALWHRLVEHGVLVRNFDRPGPLSGCLRVTIGTKEENDLFLAAVAG